MEYISVKFKFYFNDLHNLLRLFDRKQGNDIEKLFKENTMDEENLAKLLSKIVVTVDYLNLDQILHGSLKSE